MCIVCTCLYAVDMYMYMYMYMYVLIHVIADIIFVSESAGGSPEVE